MPPVYALWMTGGTTGGFPKSSIAVQKNLGKLQYFSNISGLNAPELLVCDLNGTGGD
jgi:hypothetical protein